MSDEIPEGWHRHPNGGGLVQDTAYVADTAYVGPLARVHDSATVYDSARVYGRAEVYGRAGVYDSARVYGSAHVYDSEWPESPPMAPIGRWRGHMRDRATIVIGCQTAPLDSDLDAWIDRRATEYEATAYEIAAARAFAAMCRAMMEVGR